MEDYNGDRLYTKKHIKKSVEELKLGTLPFKIKRTLPNGKYEYWCVNELNLDHLLQQLE